MNAGFVKQKRFDSIHPNETSILEQSQTICLDLRLCPCMFVSLVGRDRRFFASQIPHSSILVSQKSQIGTLFQKGSEVVSPSNWANVLFYLFVAEKL